MPRALAPLTRQTDEAVAALAAGRPVLLPTDGVYALALNAAADSAPDLVGRFRAIELPGTGGVPAFFAFNPSSAAAHDLLGTPGLALPAAGRRLLDRLAPGPITLVFPLAATGSEGGSALAWDTGLAGFGGRFALTRTGDLSARAVIDAAPFPVLLGEVQTGGGRFADTPAEAAGALAGAGIDPVLALDGGTLSGKPATVVELTPAGGGAREGGGWGVRVVRPGGYEERFVNKQLERTLLFVCTGNTCRSPMAEAIARDLIEASPTPIKTIVASAGVGAMTGAPATREAVEALKQMGIASPRLRGSRTLTRQMIAEADAIFTMTRPHLQAVLDMDPTAAAKAQVLDPEGEDVADPIGAPAVVYSETARRIREMIAVRLQELDE